MSGEVCKMKATLDALYCGAALIQSDGTLAHANPRLEALLGYDTGALEGKAMGQLCAIAHDRRRLATILADFDAPAEFEVNLLHADGSVLPAVASGQPLPDAVTGPSARLRVLTLINISAQRELVQHAAALTQTIEEQSRQIQHYNNELESLVTERTGQLRQANLDAVLMLAVASEARDDDTGAHVRRIEHLARTLAHATGMPAPEAQHLGLSAILHDIGKIHIPDQVLNKPGPLDDNERQLVQTHPMAGETILGNNPFFTLARKIARHHHENWDGTGYPDKLSGEDIPLAARIVRLVDVYDALRSPRVYKRGWSDEEAIAEIRANAGVQFDPQLVSLFVGLFEDGALDAGPVMAAD